MLIDLLSLSRSLRRQPASAAAAVLTVALTVGAGAAIFALVDAVLLTPPPFANPHALVTVGESLLADGRAAARPASWETLEAWRQRSAALATLEAYDGANLTLTGLGAAERIGGTYVTPGFLRLLGVVPVQGRPLTEDDAGEPVALISHAFWRQRLAGDPAAIGRRLVLGNLPHTIVGILPRDFFFALSNAQVWLPMPLLRSETERAVPRLRVVGRLAAGISPASLAVALDEVSAASKPPSRVVATGVAIAIAGNAVQPLTLLLAGAIVATLVAFVNLAGLLIVRSIDRGRELAVRTALGAGRFDIAKQLVLEAVALVAIGAAAGMLLAAWLTPVAAGIVLERFGGLSDAQIAMNWRVVAAVLAVAMLCACAAAAAPALAASRRNAADVLRAGATPAPRELRLRHTLVAGEVAAAFVLMVLVSLLGRSLLALLDVNPGFDPRGVMTVRVSTPPGAYPHGSAVTAFYASLQNALDGRLGANAAAITDEAPLTGDRGHTQVRLRPGEVGEDAILRVAGPGYFDVMRIPVAAGRAFTAGDIASAPARAVVSEMLARRLFAGADPIGQRIRLGSAEQTAEIVGLVGDVKHGALDEPTIPTVYLSAWQAPSRSSYIVFRNSRPDADVLAIAGEEVARLDRELPVYGRQSMSELIAASPGVPARRILTATFLAFALLAVVLCAVGLFGVVAHDVARRRTELALRIALGADAIRIVSRTLRQGAAMIVVGLMAGAVLSIWAVRAVSGLVFVASYPDVLSMAGAAALLVAVGAFAVVPAARRASRTDPMIVLRSQ